jgi:hypothetical protein
MIRDDGREIAIYWYRWPEGHQGLFAIAIAWEADASYVATTLGEATLDGIRYTALDQSQSPFGDTSEFGVHLDRAELLELPDADVFWSYVDVVAANEPNLMPRIATATGLSES